MSAAIGLGLACSGCSFAFSHGPKSRSDPAPAEYAAKCSSNLAPPLFDTLFTGTHLGGALWALSKPDQAFGSKTVRDVAIGADLGLAALYLGSAIYGYSAVSACSEIEERRAGREINYPTEVEREKPRGTAMQAARGTALQETPGSAEPQGSKRFSFGMTPQVAERACTAAGHTWSSDDGGSTCDGPAAGSDEGASTRLEFGEQGLWSIDIVAPTGAAWQDSFRRLEQRLRAQYGNPSRSELVVPEACAAATAIAACVDRGEAQVATEWQWLSGSRVLLRIPRATQAPVISLLFVRPQGSHEPIR
jgi:hypothetical protein